MEFLGTDLRHGGPNGPSAFLPRVNSQASASSITPDIDAYDAYDLTALAANLTVNSPTGTPYDFQELTIRIADNGTARTISWGSNYRRMASSPFPTITAPSKIHSLTFVYQAALALWVCVDHVVSNSLSTNISLVGGAAGGWGSPSTSVNLVVDLDAMFTASPLEEGDLLIVAAGRPHTSESQVVMASSGYTQVASLRADDSVDAHLRVWTKLMGPTPDGTVEFSPVDSNSRPVMHAIRAYRGVHQSTPLDITTVTATGIDGSNAAPPSATPATADTVSVVVGHGTLPSLTTSAYASSDLDNMIGNSTTGSSTSGVIGMGEKFHSDTGAFAPAAWTGGSSNTNHSWCAAHLILRSS